MGTGHREIRPTILRPTHTEVTVAAADAAGAKKINADPSRNYVAICNTGSNPCRFTFGPGASATNGIPIAPGATSALQGGLWVYESSGIFVDDIYVYSTLGTTVAVLEGKV